MIPKSENRFLLSLTYGSEKIMLNQEQCHG
jgi:hypothetical protein